MNSLKTNVTLNMVNTVTGILFPIITFPYAARVLMPEGIGTVDFLNSIISYIVLFTSLGIPMYAVKEVAKFRDNLELRNRTAIEILSLSFILCLFGYIAVWIIGVYVPRVNVNLSLFLVLSLTILFSTIGVNWFYQAIENFKYITVRALLFRCIAAASLFVFVKSKDDLIIYCIIVVGSTVGNNFVNFVHLRSFIPFRQIQWKKLCLWHHLKPAIHLFVLNLIISLYVQFNTVLLGFMQGVKAVGLYSAGNKLSSVVLMMVTSLGVVILPRSSNLVETGRMEEFSEISRKSMRLSVAMSLPFTFGLILLSGSLIAVFCGSQFAPSALVLRWTAPIIVFVGLTNVIGIQVLYPQGKENIVILSTLGGAVVNLALDVLLIPHFSQNGAALAIFFTELLVLVIQVMCGKKYIPFSLRDKVLVHYIIATAIMVMVLIPVIIFIDGAVAQIILGILIGAVVYGGALWIQEDELFKELLNYGLSVLHVRS